MKQGQPLADVAAEVKRIQEAKVDYRATTSALTMAPADKAAVLELSGTGTFGITPHAHGQLATYTNVPKDYYDRCLRESPDLLATNVNHWLHVDNEPRLVRTLEGNVRAFLSNRYRVLDNYSIVENLLPEVMRQPGMRVESVNLSDTKFHLKCVFPNVQEDISRARDGSEPVMSGIYIGNSEVGSRSLVVAPLLYELICTNGMVMLKQGKRKAHIGRIWEADDSEGAQELFSDEALQADDAALWLKLRDVVRATMDEAIFTRLVGTIRDLRDDKLEKPTLAVERLTDRYLTKEEGDSVLNYLIQGGQPDAWGLVQSITRMAQDVDSYERSTELEALGGFLVQEPETLRGLIKA